MYTPDYQYIISSSYLPNQRTKNKKCETDIKLWKVHNEETSEVKLISILNHHVIPHEPKGPKSNTAQARLSEPSTEAGTTNKQEVSTEQSKEASKIPGHTSYVYIKDRKTWNR